MKRIVWRDGLTLLHGPNTSEVYQWDWGPWLDGDTVENPPVIVADAGVTAELEFLGSDYVDVRVTTVGATVGAIHDVMVRVTSVPRGRVDDRTLRLQIKQR